MMKETEIIRETPLVSYYGCCPEFGQYIELYAHDLSTAEVGDGWGIEDQNCYPNREFVWNVSYDVVYKDKFGVLLLFRNEEPLHRGLDPELKLIWCELHKEKTI